MNRIAISVFVAAALAALAILFWPETDKKEKAEINKPALNSEEPEPKPTKKNPDDERAAPLDLLEVFAGLDKQVFNEDKKEPDEYKGARSDKALPDYESKCPQIKRFVSENPPTPETVAKFKQTKEGSQTYAFLRAYAQTYSCEALKKNDEFVCDKLKNVDKILYRECLQNFLWIDLLVYHYSIRKDTKDFVIKHSKTYREVLSRQEDKDFNIIEVILNSFELARSGSADAGCKRPEYEKYPEIIHMCRIAANPDMKDCDNVNNKRGILLCYAYKSAMILLRENKPWNPEEIRNDFPYLLKNAAKILDPAQNKTIDCKDAATEWIDYVCKNGETPYNF